MQKKVPSFTYEVIIVDDGSPDGGATSTVSIAQDPMNIAQDPMNIAQDPMNIAYGAMATYSAVVHTS